MVPLYHYPPQQPPHTVQFQAVGSYSTLIRCDGLAGALLPAIIAGLLPLGPLSLSLTEHSLTLASAPQHMDLI